MTRHPRSRWLATVAMAAVLVLAVAACKGREMPNTTLDPHSEFGRAIDYLWRELLTLGTIVFVLVETALIVTLVKWRRREGRGEPKQVHGNTTLEITWTLIPAVVLASIAVPTVRTIFKTEAKAVPNALQVEVVGHQWWWEFRYPQLGITTANELYLPVGKTVNFALTSKDVIHSFWIPELAGKRDVITNHTNYLWFTPESTYAWNGFCAEYCGSSHANMHFRVFTVTQPEFDAWAAHQATGPAYAAAAPAPPPTLSTTSTNPAAPGDSARRAGTTPSVGQIAQSTNTSTPAASSAGQVVATPATSTYAATYTTATVPLHLTPTAPIPAGLTMSNVTGDPARGAQLYKTGACLACHVIQGVSAGIIGPNLTHVGSRTTLAGSMYPMDTKHLQLWIKNAPLMKPGSLMPALGKGAPGSGMYDDQQIADIAAYLMLLK